MVRTHVAAMCEAHDRFTSLVRSISRDFACPPTRVKPYEDQLTAFRAHLRSFLLRVVTRHDLLAAGETRARLWDMLQDLYYP